MSKRNRTFVQGVLVAAMAIVALALVPAVVPAAAMGPMSGGISEQGRAAHPEYPLKLVFAAETGAYLAAIDVEIYNEAGDQVLKTHSEGPWLFVDLAPGTYRVKAVRPNGETASAMVTVGGDGQTVAGITWEVME